MKTATVQVGGEEKVVKYPVWSGILSKKKYGFKPLEFMMEKANEGNDDSITLDEEELLMLLWAGLIWQEPELELQELGEKVEYSELINASKSMIEVIVDAEKIKKQ